MNGAARRGYTEEVQGRRTGQIGFCASRRSLIFPDGFFSLAYITDVLLLFVTCSFAVSCSVTLVKAAPEELSARSCLLQSALVAASGPHAEAVVGGSAAAPKQLSCSFIALPPRFLSKQHSMSWPFLRTASFM